MTPERMLKLVNAYEMRLGLMNIPKKQMQKSRTFESLDKDEMKAHAHFLCDGVKEYANDPDKWGRANRHFTAIQMLLSFAGLYTLENLMNHNKPTDDNLADEGALFDDKDSVCIFHRWMNIGFRADLIQGVEDIFFESSATKSFKDDGKRLAFRNKWLGRYLECYPDWVYVALGEKSKVLGYLVGCPDDPANTYLFHDLACFDAFRNQTAEYPAHLHINIHKDFRGKGVGKTLIDMFLWDLADYGVRGAHVVVPRGAPNVSFYGRCGFREIDCKQQKQDQLVFLGKKLEEVSDVGLEKGWLAEQLEAEKKHKEESRVVTDRQ